MLALGDDLCLDAVSRPDAFEHLWPKLRAGYLLDALDRLDRPVADPRAVGVFVSALAKAVTSRRPSAGRGEDVRLAGDSVIGSGLELDGELLQLSAFTAGHLPSQGRIVRPSRRNEREAR